VNESASTFLLFANGGVLTYNNERVVSLNRTKRINSIMQLCGLYDEAGEFSFRVGLPGKSGVGGGIVAVHPGKYSISAWSPRLNEKGNTYKGVLALELFTTITESSIF
jgi:glutaminase